MPTDRDLDHPACDPADCSSDCSAELDAIRAAFPALAWESAQRIDEGWDHVVVICRGCSGVDSLGHRDLVFRFPTDEQALAQLPQEIAVLDHLAPGV
ncbi:MAG: aminoglycoside phosphotransferase family protein, partial [Dietzia sp.]